VDAAPARDAAPAGDAAAVWHAAPVEVEVPAADATRDAGAVPLDSARVVLDGASQVAAEEASVGEGFAEGHEVSAPEGAEGDGAVSGVAFTEPEDGYEPQEPDAPVDDTPAPMPVVKAVADPQHVAVPSIERALSGPMRDRNLSWHGKVKIVAGTGQGPGKRDQEALDRARARLPLKTPKRVLVLGCTSGAGQTLTTLMTGHILASLREEPVAAVDLHDGALGRHSAPAAWLEDVLDGKPPQNAGKARPDGLHPTPKTTPGRLDVIASRDPLRDGDELKLAMQLDRHYSLAMLDPDAAGLMKLLMLADQLIVVVPASVEGAGALADTREWLNLHGFAELATHAVTVINGVSRRSLPDVENAESVARGRCRAIVRVPWDDLLPVGGGDPSTLRPQTRVAYTALAGVLVAGLAAEPVRTRQQEKW
jgi:hypothetical protein